MPEPNAQMSSTTIELDREEVEVVLIALELRRIARRPNRAIPREKASLTVETKFAAALKAMR